MSAKIFRNRRFTLLEMLLVVAILAIVLGLVLPAIGRKPFSLLLRETDSALVGACDWGSALALRTGSPVELRWERGEDQVRLRRMPEPGSGGKTEAAATVVKEFRVPVEVVQEENGLGKTGWRCVFHADGGAGGETLPLLIRGEPFELRVGKATGHGWLRKRDEP